MISWLARVRIVNECSCTRMIRVASHRWFGVRCGLEMGDNESMSQALHVDNCAGTSVDRTCRLTLWPLQRGLARGGGDARDDNLDAYGGLWSKRACRGDVSSIAVPWVPAPRRVRVCEDRVCGVMYARRWAAFTLDWRRTIACPRVLRSARSDTGVDPAAARNALITHKDRVGVAR